MNYYILDLEWNGAYSQKWRRYVNEIIEIGAVRLNQNLDVADTFSVLIKPVIGKKISQTVSDLTGITQQEVEGGYTFAGAVAGLRKWIGKQQSQTAILTWSRSDLTVLLENCRYFMKLEHIPFLEFYADVQGYCEQKLSIGAGEKLALDTAVQLLEIADTGHSHRALDDCIQTAAVLKKLYDPVSFTPHLRLADQLFYDELNFKPYYISTLKPPHISAADLQFICQACGHRLGRRAPFKPHHHAFYALYTCSRCKQQYTARIQIRQLFDRVEVRRKITPVQTERTETQ